MKFNPRTVHLRVGAVVITFYTICFICGVAWNTYTISCKENIDNDDLNNFSHLIQNTLLLFLFMMQHSLLKLLKHELDLKAVHQRLLYIFSTTSTLHIVHTFWKQCSVVYTVPLTIPVIRSLHVVAWVWLVAAVLLVDSSELFGFKHIEHAEKGLQEPICYKSQEARRLLQHYRHPTAVGPIIILLTCKTMTSDRLLITAVYLMYTFLRSNLDYKDYLYLRYVSYPTKKYTFKKVEIRSKATVLRETQSSFCFSDDDDIRSTASADTDLGYSSSPTHQNPEFYRALVTSTPEKKSKIITSSMEETENISTSFLKHSKSTRKKEYTYFMENKQN